MRRLRNLPPSTTQRDFIRLTGGLDLTSPDLGVDPGALRDCLNYETGLQGGYRRIAGYERFDGRPEPHQQTFTELPVSVTSGAEVGLLVTGLESGATGVVAAHEDGVLYVTKTSGDFVQGEMLDNSFEVVGPPILQGVGGSATALRVGKAVQDLYREDIEPVPGIGAVRAVFVFDEDIFAIRDDATEDFARLYRSSSDGWQEVDTGEEILFRDGSTQLFDGDAIEGQDSGATAVIRKVMRRSGSWDADAEGALLIESVVGTFTEAESLMISNGVVATADSANQPVRLSSGAAYQIDKYNDQVYGANGAGPAFAFDGDWLALVRTRMSPDTPHQVRKHQNHLCLAFRNSLQFSAINDIFNWSPLLGAGEVLAPSFITGMRRQPGEEGAGALAVATEDTLSVLYGTSAEDFQLISLQDEMGALRGSMQNMGVALMLSERGVTLIGQSQRYGNFEHSILSARISPWLQSRAQGQVLSHVVRGKNQYRVLFPSGSGLIVTLAGREVVGMTPISYPDSFTCVTSEVVSGGRELLLAGGANGYVYRLDVGPSFDGAPIVSYLQLPYGSNESLRARKRYRRALLEVTADSAVRFDTTTSYALGDPDVASHEKAAQRDVLGAGQWDEAQWDTFYWDSASNQMMVRVDLSGSGDNASIYIHDESDYLLPWQIQSMIIEYSARRGER